MTIEPNLVSLILIVASGFCLALTTRTARWPSFPGRAGFLGMQACVCWWTLSAAMEHAIEPASAKTLWAELAWLGISGSPFFWSLFVWDYVFGDRRQAPRTLYELTIAVAVIFWLVAMTNDVHHSLYRVILLPDNGHSDAPIYEHGWLFYVFITVSYTIMLASEGAIVWALLRGARHRRRHFVGLLAASIPPWLCNINDVCGFVKISNFDLTSPSFFVMASLFYWLIRRQNLFDLTPIAHHVLFDAIPDPVLILDETNRIVQSNDAAERLLDGVGPTREQSLRQILGPTASLLADGGGCNFTHQSHDHSFDVELVPLTTQNRSVGRLMLFRDVTLRKAAERHLHETMHALEDQLQNNCDLHNHLREMSLRDSLTGLHNRRFLTEIGPAFVADCLRSEQPLAAVMIDIDHFKLLNDMHGHQAGDHVLATMGQFLQKKIRASDAVFRFGGEEFLVLFARTSAAQAFQRAEDLRSDFAGLPISFHHVRLFPTLSAGLAMAPEDATSLNELLFRADQALYQAKDGGRDQVRRWQRPASSE